MRLRRRLLPVLALALVAPVAPLASAAEAPTCAPAEHAGGDWPMYGHDEANTRHQPLERTIGPLQAPTLTRTFAFSASAGGGTGDFTSTPVVQDGCLYIGSTDGWVFAVNADTGEPVWSTELPDGGAVYSGVRLVDGRLYAGVSRTGRPYVVALDQATGAVLWRTRVDEQPGSDVYGAPVLVDGVLGIGVSGGAAELSDEETRYGFQGSFTLLETQDDPERGRVAGTLLKKTWTVHGPEIEDGFAGATIWSTPAVDQESRMAWVGTGNPFQPQKEHENTNAIVKLDLRRESPTFGEIVGHYKGIVDEYAPAEQLPCEDLPGNPPPYYPQGVGSCAQLDLDFGASPNLTRGADGRLLVGAGQKAGVYHQIDAETMEPVWKATVGPPSAVGGIVGSTAVDDTGVYGPITLGGYLWSVDRAAGTPRWVAPVADGAHWGNPVTLANGVLYTVGLTGMLSAYEARTGAPLLHRPMGLDTEAGDPAAAWGGVAVARNTVYATIGMTGLSNGYVLAYRPGTTLPLPAASPSPSATAGPSPAPAAGAGTQVLTGPQAQFYGYLTPAVVAAKGRPVTYTNTDIVRHDVVQDPRTDGVAGDGSAPWCGRFPAGRCPLFWTDLLGVGESAPVQGLGGLASRSYSFSCSLHPGMRGTLVVP